MTDNQHRVLNFLKREPNRWVNPTTVGMAMGKTYAQASSWASRVLKALVKLKLVERKKPGVYKAI